MVLIHHARGRGLSAGPAAGAALVAGGSGTGAVTAAALTQVVQVIGRRPDTLAYVGRAGHLVLNVPRSTYSLVLNERWIQEGIDAGRSFLLASHLTSQNLVRDGELTVFGQEVMYLMQRGYVQVGNYLVPGR